jgi:nucleotide-binding universal stress UspA family protein
MPSEKVKKMTKKVPETIPKVEYKKILYTTDLSESGRYAFHHAASLTTHYGAELTAIHVVEGGPELDRRLLGYVDEKLWGEIKTRNLQEARDLLISRKRDNVAIKECVGQFCEEVQADAPDQADVTYSIIVKMGDPAREIIEEAQTGNYDLIVMGSHSRGSLVNSVMGDTVKLVVRRSEIPVLVVRVPE